MEKPNAQQPASNTAFLIMLIVLCPLFLSLGFRIPNSFPRQQQPKSAAPSRLRLYPHFSSYSLDCFAHDGKSDARAFVLRRSMKALEHQKHSILRLRGDSDAIVLNPKPHIILERFRPNLDVRLGPFRDEFNRVAQQVINALS